METITLGGRQFEARPLKLGQLRGVLDALEQMAGKAGGALVEAAAGVVAAGIAPAHPDISAEAVLDVEATLDELNAAVATVLRVAGLRPAGETQPTGEARPVASQPDNSAPSMAPSPPAAAIPTASSTA